MSIIAWNKTSSAGRWLRNLGISLAFAAALPGCMAHARGEVVYDYPVTYVERAPARVETYPRAEYHGRPAYLVDGRWYYQNNRRWVVFEDEPGELRDYRSRHYARTPVRYGSYSQPYARHDDRRDDRRAAERRAEDRRRDERRAAEARADRRRAEERRAAEHRADQRRDAERRAEQRRNDQRRAEQARDERRRADEQRSREREAAEHRANTRRVEDRRDDDRRNERKARVAERRTQDQRKRDRSRPDDGDRRYRND